MVTLPGSKMPRNMESMTFAPSLLKSLPSSDKPIISAPICSSISGLAINVAKSVAKVDDDNCNDDDCDDCDDDDGCEDIDDLAAASVGFLFFFDIDFLPSFELVADAASAAASAAALASRFLFLFNMAADELA